MGNALKAKGVTFVEDCKILEHDQARRRVNAIETTRGSFKADVFVVATERGAERWQRLGFKDPCPAGQG